MRSSFQSSMRVMTPRTFLAAATMLAAIVSGAIVVSPPGALASVPRSSSQFTHSESARATHQAGEAIVALAHAVSASRPTVAWRGTRVARIAQLAHSAFPKSESTVRPDQGNGGVSCTFDGNDDITGISDVSPGEDISVVCTGFQPDEEVAATEFSPLFIESEAAGDLDLNYQYYSTNDIGDLNATYVVPDPFVASDPGATCPPSADQLETIGPCEVVFVDQFSDGDDAPLFYAPTCTFNGNSEVAGVSNVVPGENITVSCTGFEAEETVVATEVSSLFVATGSVNEFDPNYQEYTTDSSGDLNATFVVPDPFVAPDPNAVCPPTASQLTSYGPCVLSLTDGLGDGNVTDLNYAATSPAASSGYWMVGSDGGVFAFGNAPYEGSLPGDHVHVDDIVGVVGTKDDGGYWMVGRDGGVFAFGDAGYVGSLPGDHVHVDNIVAVVPTASGNGYWMVGSDGGVFAFGDAPYEGSLPGDHIHVDDIVGVVGTKDGGGYWMIGKDGGVFAFGDAGFVGSLPGDHVTANDIVAVVPTPDDGGYWMIGRDGGVFAFGDAGFLGSLPGKHVSVDNIVAVIPTSDGGGYWMVGSNGSVYPFGDAVSYGSLPADGVHVDNIVGVVRS